MNDELIEVSNWLNRAHDIDGEIKALEVVREKNRSIAERCTASFENSGSTGGGHENSQERIIHQLCDDDIKIRERLSELLRTRSEIEAAIHSVSNSKVETVLSMRYLAYLKMYQIADMLGVDRKTVNRRHIKGLEIIFRKSKEK